MKYIYDIVLNFNEYILDFYDWKDTDNLVKIRKAPVFKVSINDLKEIKNNRVVFSREFLNKIEYKTESYKKNVIVKYRSVFLLTDGFEVIAINSINNTYSKLLLSDEEEVLKLDLDKTRVDYNIKFRKEICKNRIDLENEKIVNDYLKKLFEENNVNKIKYIYYEYFNKLENDLNKIKRELKNCTNDTFLKLIKN